MKYTVIKQFPGRIAGDSSIYENLSAYLMANQIRNDIHIKGRGRNWRVETHLPENDLVMKVIFHEITPFLREPKTEMVGEIKTKYDNKKYQVAASNLCQVLSGYMPSLPKEDAEEE